MGSHEFLIYAKTKRVVAETLDPELLRVYAAEEDQFIDARVELLVATPQLRIIKANSTLASTIDAVCQESVAPMDKLAGLSLGPGFTKKLLHAIPEAKRCTVLNRLALTCGYWAVGHPSYQFREAVAAGRMTIPELHRQVLAEEGYRFKDSCAAFAEDSPVIKSLGFELVPQAGPGPTRPASESALSRYVGRYTMITVSRPRKDLMVAHASLEDIAQNISVEIKVTWPGMVIRKATAHMRRVANKECYPGVTPVGEIVGLKIERGLRPVVQEKLAGPNGCIHVASLVLDSCLAIVQARLSAELMDAKWSRPQADRDQVTRRWLESLPLLRNTCVTCADESPLVQRLGVSWCTQESQTEADAKRK